MQAKRKSRKISLDSVAESVDKGISELDGRRKNGLEGLAKARKVKAKIQRKEAERLKIVYGEQDPRVKAAEDKINANTNLIRDLDIEVARAELDKIKVDQNTWLLLGYVRDPDLNGVAGLTIALYDENGYWIRSLGYGCTNSQGHFRLEYSAKSPESKDRAVSSKLFLYVLDKNLRVIYRDQKPIYVRPGNVVYRDIFLAEQDDTCTPPESTGQEMMLPPDAWVVEGQIVDESGEGIGGLTVSLYDKDLFFDDKLGTTVTEDGYFRFVYRTEAFRDLIEAKPDLYLKVFNKDGDRLYSSKKAIKFEAGKVESLNIKIKGGPAKSDSR